MFLESEAGAQAGAAGSAAQRPWPGWAPDPGRSWNNIGCFGVFAVLKHNVYYFTVSLLVLLLVGHVTRRGASDWLAAPLSLFCCYLMANKRCRLWACAVLMGRVSCGSCCGWMRSSQRQAVSSSSGSCELFFFGTARPAGRSRPRQQRTQVRASTRRWKDVGVCFCWMCCFAGPFQPFVADSQPSICSSEQRRALHVVPEQKQAGGRPSRLACSPTCSPTCLPSALSALLLVCWWKLPF